VEKDPFAQSFIPYLDNRKHPFVLKITFPAKEPGPWEKTYNPFIVLQDSDPLTRLFMAKLVTPGGSVLKDLYLLVQRDQYRLPLPLSHVHNNRDIERSWQEATRIFAESHVSGFIFAPRPSPGDNINAFRSLFYCQLKDQFFHPLCPSCGGPLNLCTEDDLLENAGLSPYSSSLERYLYCPSCAGTEKEPLFFSQRKGKDESSALEDLPALIAGFEKIPGKAREPFPCSSCPETTACYGPEARAGERIIPFSFFPFHVMVFGSYPVDAIHYLKSPLPKAEITPEVVEEPMKEAESGAIAPSEEPEASSAVIDILTGLRRKWAAELPKPQERPTARKAEDTPEPEIKELPVDMLEKTMIFSPAEMETATSTTEAPAEKEPPPVTPPEPPQVPSGEPVLEKTMIFSPGTAPAPPAPGKRPSEKGPPVGPEHREPAPAEILEKTVISSPKEKKEDVPKQQKKTEKTEAIPETVIMSLDDLEGKK